MKNLFLVFSMAAVLFVNGCAPASVEPLQANTPSQPVEDALKARAPLPTGTPYTIAEVEELAGFDVKEPAYLPAGVSLDFAAHQKSPYPNVILHYKLIHETYGDMGAFFQIRQEPQGEASPNPTACGVAGDECETLQIGDLAVKHRLTAPTESLMWEMDGFSFELLRTAGEPDKVYTDELLKVAGSMK